MNASTSPPGGSGPGGAGTAGGVLSLDGEKAVWLLMVTLAQHRRGEDALTAVPQIRGRLQVLPPDSATSRVRRQSVLVRTVSILESYVHGQLVARLGPLAPAPRSALVESLYGDFEDKGVASWPQTADYFKKHVHQSVTIKSHISWERVDAVIEARNAVVHGLGRFTARQARRGVPARIEPHLKALKFLVPADLSHVAVTAPAVRDTGLLLRGYIEWLDGLLAAMP